MQLEAIPSSLIYHANPTMANQNSKLRNKKQSAAASRAERRDTGIDREKISNASLSGMKRLGEAVFLIIFLLCVISLV